MLEYSKTSTIKTLCENKSRSLEQPINYQKESHADAHCILNMPPQVTGRKISF